MLNVENLNRSRQELFEILNENDISSSHRLGDKTPNASNQQAYRELSDLVQFSNEDRRLWWHSTGPMFTEMLDMANYDILEQYKHLHIFMKSVVPFLGVYPRNGRDRWMSILTRYGTPFELSLNCNDSVVRYTYEPINDDTGSSADPFNTHAIWDALKELVNLEPTIDTEYFRHFKRDLTLSEAESDILRDNNLARSKIMTQNKLALDLKGSQFVVKTYIYPALKAIATGKSVKDLIFDSVRTLAERQDNLGPALDMLEEYIDSRAPGGTTCPRLLSCDLVDPAQSRIKIYVSEQVVSLDAMRDMWTLGGRRSGPTTLAGMELIQELWDLLKVPEGLRSYTEGYLPLGSTPDELLPGMANYTLLPNHPAPEPQVYFSVFGMKDMAIADALTSFFQRHGWSDMAKKYKDSLKAYYPDENHDTMNYLHAYISFSYRKNKPYLGVYLQSFETGAWASVPQDTEAYPSKTSQSMRVIRL